MTKLEWLNGVFEMQRNIRILGYRMESLKSMLSGGGRRLDAERVDGSPDPQRNERLMCEMMELEDRRDREKEKLASVRQCLKDAIGRLGNLQEESVMSMRYIEGMEWKQIAHALKVTENYVYKLRRFAEEKIEIPEEMQGDES